MPFSVKDAPGSWRLYRSAEKASEAGIYQNSFDLLRSAGTSSEESDLLWVGDVFSIQHSPRYSLTAQLFLFNSTSRYPSWF